MYVELQLSAQDVTELQRKQELRAVNNNNSSRTDTPPASPTSTSAPGLSSSHFSPQRARTHFDSKDCTSLSATHTQTCYDQFCPSHSSPGRASASVCPHHSCSQQSGCFLSSSSTESPMPASAIEEVCHHLLKITTHRLIILESPLFFLLSEAQTSSAHEQIKEQIKQSGAVIESFVSHSPGFYSGTFSGERAHSSEDDFS